MEAKELRMGNYVSQDGEEIHGLVGLTIHKFELNQIKLEPIPLTEEWLKKFGFESDEITFDKSGFTIGWFRNNEFYYLPVGQIIIRNKHQIKYVHQLQNLYFALTGEELNKQD